MGSIGAFRKENIHVRTAEMGYYIAEEYWGRGDRDQRRQAALRLPFENTDLLRIFAEPFAYNQASCRVLKSRLHPGGGITKNAVKNGRVLDMKMYSIVKE